MCDTKCGGGHCHKSTALLLLRLAVGFVFLAHGLDKLNNMSGTVGFFASLGIPAFLAYVVAWVETLGGVALILGIFAKHAARLLAIVMVVAIVLVKSKMGLRSAEIDLVLLASSILIATLGAGRFSLSRFCKCGCHSKGEGECKVCKAIGCQACGNNTEECDSCKSGTCEVK